MNMKKGTFMSRLLKIMYIYLVFTITVTLNFLLKVRFLCKLQSDFICQNVNGKLQMYLRKIF